MIDKHLILDAFNFRHACKVFDTTKKIPDEDFNFLMETARLSPSSFGMEHWRFIVISDGSLKEALQPHCWNQKQIASCSHLIVVLAKTEAVQDEAYIMKMFSRHTQDKEQLQASFGSYMALLEQKIKAFVSRYMYKMLTKKHAVYEWCTRQCYIAAANMATSAAMIGIDSCFIEGFKKEKLEDALGIDSNKEEIAVLLTFGYRVNEQPAKNRLTLEEIMEVRSSIDKHP